MCKKKYVTAVAHLWVWKMNSVYFTFIPIGKLVLQHAGCSGRHLPHKLLPHCTSTDQIIFLRCVNTGIFEDVEGSVYLVNTGVGTPDPPVRIESLYRLSFHGHRLDNYSYLICYSEDCYRDNISKVRFLFLHTMKEWDGVEILLHTFTMSVPDGSEWSVARPCHCTMGKGDSVSTE